MIPPTPESNVKGISVPAKRKKKIVKCQNLNRTALRNTYNEKKKACPNLTQDVLNLS